MKRLYGDYKCDVCLRTSSLGWVYVCTQDVEPGWGIDVANDGWKNTFSVSADPRGNVPQFKEWHEPEPELCSWTQKAIDGGHYSLEQVETLRAQRQTVIDNANDSVINFTQQKMGTVTGMTAPLMEFDPSKDEKPDILKLFLFPVCKLRACQNCRPSYRDRTWQRFEDVFSKDTAVTLTAESRDIFDKRPLCSASIMRSIGLSKPPTVTSTATSSGLHLPYAPRQEPTLNNTSSTGEADETDETPALASSTSVADEKTSPDDAESTDNGKSRLIKHFFTRRRGKSAAAKKRKLEDQAAMDSEETLSTSTDDDAASTKALRKLSTEQLYTNEMAAATGEAEMKEGGISDDESVDLGTADIIASV